jgi:hypothetical protein
MKAFKLIIILALLFSTYTAIAQGCSDAGFCTMGSFKPESSDSLETVQNQLKFGASYGLADHNITIFANYLEYSRQINEKFSMDVKITSISQDGNNISSFGVSDVFLTGNYKARHGLSYTLGVKIPTNKSDKKVDGSHLPMDYQSTLGTVDLIVGVGYQIKKWQFVAALQQPLSQNNNEFAGFIPGHPELADFVSTYEYQRKGDVLLRISRPFKLNDKLQFTPSILPIYHLANDEATYIIGYDPEEIEGSKGLTLNVNGYLDYQLNSKNSIQFNAGMPLIVRDVRPDGLTRSFIATLEYRYSF